MKLRTQLLSWLTKRPMRTTPEDWQHLRFSFSQFGEDLVLLNYLKEQRGFYVDVGAHHPVQFSNTYLLHRRGWRGVNIDATEEAIARFVQARPHDVNLVAAISDQVKEVEFGTFQSPALNRIYATGTAELERQKQEQPKLWQSMTGTRKLTTRTLAAVLRETVPAGQKIDFMNIDCEGHDLAVLRSNDWYAYAPQVLAVEDWQDAEESIIVAFLREHHYRLIATCELTRIFQHRQPTA